MGIIKEKIDINKLSNKEITKFARKLANTNTALWNAVCTVEYFLTDPIFKAYLEDYDGREEFLAKLACVFKKIKKNDEEFINVNLNESYFQDFDYFTQQLQRYLE